MSNYKKCKYVELDFKKYASVEVIMPDGRIMYDHAEAFCKLHNKKCVHYPCEDFEEKKEK